MCGQSIVWWEAKAGFLKLLPIQERIDSKLTIDFVTDLPKSNNYTNIIVMTNRLSKDTFLFGTSSIEAVRCAELFIDRYHLFLGFPSYLTSNRGSD